MKRFHRLKMNNWDDFINYVQENDAFAMLDKRPNKTAVLEHLKDTGDMPPGVELSTEIVVNVNKPISKGE